MKGFIIGVIAALALDRVFGVVYNDSISFMVFSYVFVPAASSYAALQFTGASTFTSISGVRREMLVAVPLYVVAAAVSLVALALYKFFQWGLI
ncbi:MAG: hypothetical protein GWN67_16405 [Phycisphaerae bacterium]|nr:hypothetical protein [Phycisphaerae bacterium]